MVNGYADLSESCRETSAELGATAQAIRTGQVIVMKVRIDANIDREVNVRK